ncbi:lipopolysaccharide assembly protein LapB [Neisseria sp. Ec49-e6-T10]|uniref:lipopolysaccharide assembly protein LapB n=1 Tax=Neisseria sp. Ec49-e6-T10 TaxID=3140744 RepID=UPI003EBB551E
MELEIWWLLLCPLFFGMGWLAARIDMRTVLKHAMSIPSGFFKSLDALVENKTDVAAEALNEVTRQQPGALELQLTLGKLYRRRGENDKAIRLHQSLLESPDLVSDSRNQISFQLGLDFQNAGLVDRAEQIFNGLLESNMGKPSRQLLLGIYQQDRDWQKAIETARTLSHDQQTYQFEVAQFFCELAQAALFKSDLIQARQYITEALQANKKCARASIILGDIEQKSNHYDEAIEAWQSIEKQNPEFLSMVAERLYDVYDEQGKAIAGLDLLIGYCKTFPQLELVDLLYQKTLLLRGENAAIEVVRESAYRHPTLNNVYRLIEARITGLSPEGRQDAEVTRAVIAKTAQKTMMYRCKRCSFKSQVFFWHCPACNEWESFTPNRVEI